MPQFKQALLVSPSIDENTYWSFSEVTSRFILPGMNGRRKAVLPSLALLGLGNHLKRSGLYDNVRLVDLNVDDVGIESQIRESTHVYVTHWEANKDGFKYVVQLARRLGKKVIEGGPGSTEEDPNGADFRVLREAENVMPKLLEDLVAGKESGIYSGTIVNPDNFFRPDYSLINPNDYLSTSLQFTRGCPESCEFCGIEDLLGKAVRAAPVDHITSAIEDLFRLGFRQKIFFVDDNLIGVPHKTLRLLQAIKTAEDSINYHFPKYTQLSLRLADDSIIINNVQVDEKTVRQQEPIMLHMRRWMRQAGFRDFFIGVETPNPESLKGANKGHNLRAGSITDQITLISKETGAGVMMGMIYGFDQDTLATADLVTQFINGSTVPMAMLGLLNALPRTKLWDRLNREGRLISNTTGNNTDGTSNFRFMNLSVEAAEQKYVQMMREIYAPGNYFNRVLGELRLLDPAYVSTGLSSADKVYSVATILLTSKHSPIFWRYLPNAVQILNDRFDLFTPKFYHGLEAFFGHCAKYAHFRSQTERIAEDQAERQYQALDRKSWKEIQLIQK